jgi:hypothetical protein
MLTVKLRTTDVVVSCQADRGSVDDQPGAAVDAVGTALSARDGMLALTAFPR